MATWIDETLEPGETIVYRARATWSQVAVATAVFFAVLCAINAAITSNPVAVIFWATNFTLFMGLPFYLGETVITDRRILQWTPFLVTESKSALNLDAVVAVERSKGFLGDQIRVTADEELASGKIRVSHIHSGIVAEPARYLEELLRALPFEKVKFTDKSANCRARLAIVSTIFLQCAGGFLGYLCLVVSSWPWIDQALEGQPDIALYGVLLGLIALTVPVCLLIARSLQYLAIIFWSYFLTLEEMRQFVIAEINFDGAGQPSNLVRWRLGTYARLIQWLYQAPVTLRPNGAESLSGRSPEQD
ncbi:MAG: hypothetical protein AAF495_05340 [Pseudomonadota bacterium]